MESSLSGHSMWLGLSKSLKTTPCVTIRTRIVLHDYIRELSMVLDDGLVPFQGLHSCTTSENPSLGFWQSLRLCVHCFFSYDSFLGLASCKVDYSLGLTTNMWWIPLYALIQEPTPWCVSRKAHDHMFWTAGASSSWNRDCGGETSRQVRNGSPLVKRTLGRLTQWLLWDAICHALPPQESHRSEYYEGHF